MRNWISQVFAVTGLNLRTIKERIAGYEECLRRSKLPHTKELRLTSQMSATPRIPVPPNLEDIAFANHTDTADRQNASSHAAGDQL